MVPDTLPPFRHISSKPISASAASDILNTYIANSEIHPHLHPDALITPSGVSFSSHGGPSGGVVIHNLRRVAAGLRGEYLEPETTPEPEEKEQQDKGAATTNGENQDGAQQGWQDMSEYEREEGGFEVGELGDRSNFVASGGDAPGVEPTAALQEQEEVGSKRKAKDDKEARKKAKKERNKEFKKQKENKKREKKGAEDEE